MTLSPHFGALTPVPVVPVSGQRLTPLAPPPPFYGADRFGV